VRNDLTSTYDEYFGQKIFAVGSKVQDDTGLACGYWYHVLFFKLLQQSPDGPTGYPDRGQIIMMVAVWLGT